MECGFESLRPHQFKEKSMNVTITTSYPLRDKNITRYISFPEFSEEIQETMISQLEYLNKNHTSFSLEMKVTKNSS